MTWHTFFSTTTLEDRHLLASYALVFLLQGGYFAWLLRNWRTARRPRA